MKQKLEDMMESEELDEKLEFPPEKQRPYWIDYVAALGEELGSAAGRVAGSIGYILAGGLPRRLQLSLEEKLDSERFSAETATELNMKARIALYVVAGAGLAYAYYQDAPDRFGWALVGGLSGVLAGMLETVARCLYADSRNGDMVVGDPMTSVLCLPYVAGEFLYGRAVQFHRRVGEKTRLRRGK